MENRFKFRAYCPELKKMYEVLCFNFYGEPTITVQYNPVVKIRLRDCYVMQCTGQFGKNKKLSYENDICKMIKAIYVIIWDSKTASFKLAYENSKNPDNWVELREDKKFEIIGDIHQNPELLRGEK